MTFFGYSHESTLAPPVARRGLPERALTAAAELQVAQGQTAEGRRLLEEARQIIEAKGNVVALGSLEAALAELTPETVNNHVRGRGG